MPWPAMIARAKNTASTELICGLDILGFCAARCTVPWPTPISRAISAQDQPCVRNSTTLAAFYRLARAADQLTVGAGQGDARAHTFADQFSLEFGDAGEDAALIRAEVKISPD